MAKPIFGKMVILKLVSDTSNEKLNHDFRIHTSVDGDPLIFAWTKKNGYQCEVPTKIEFFDAVGAKKVAQENYAQHLLNAYPNTFTLVGEVEQQLVVQPTIKESEADVLKRKLKEAEARAKELEAKIAVSSEVAVAEQKPDVPKRGRPKKVKEIIQ